MVFSAAFHQSLFSRFRVGFYGLTWVKPFMSYSKAAQVSFMLMERFFLIVHNIILIG
jgi:hypothetical protein